jgi:hypothetical protein
LCSPSQTSPRALSLPCILAQVRWRSAPLGGDYNGRTGSTATTRSSQVSSRCTASWGNHWHGGGLDPLLSTFAPSWTWSALTRPGRHMLKIPSLDLATPGPDVTEAMCAAVEAVVAMAEQVLLACMRGRRTPQPTIYAPPSANTKGELLNRSPDGPCRRSSIASGL